jgi:tRNA(fMet)-specific endonuclease VapC
MILFIDTSVFVDVLRSKPDKSSKSLFKSLQNENSGYTSVITIAELSVGAYKSPRKDALNKTFKLLTLVNVLDLNKEIAVEGGRIYAELVKIGKEIELNDCLIAATSLSLGIRKIVTKDVEHFKRINGIEAVIPEDLGF